jgi:hypothetical protein
VTHVAATGPDPVHYEHRRSEPGPGLADGAFTVGARALRIGFVVVGVAACALLLALGRVDDIARLAAVVALATLALIGAVDAVQVVHRVRGRAR